MSPEECLDKYIKLVYYFSNRLPLSRRGDAEHEGIVALLKCNQNFDPERGLKFMTFAFPHVRKAIIFDVREHKWRKRSVTEFDEIIHANKVIEDRSFSIALQEAISQLDDKEKEIIKLKYFDSERVEAIAKKLNVTRQTIFNWEKSAISKLRTMLFLEEKIK